VHITNDKQGLVRAYRYVNNLKKHSNCIFEYTIKTKSLYLSNDLFASDDLFPSDFKIWWSELPFDSDERNTNQYNNYNELLKGKELIKTIEEIYKYIMLNYNYYL